MGVQRVVPDLTTQSMQTDKRFYERVLGLKPIMDHGWIVTLADPVNFDARISLMTHDATAHVVPDVSVQVHDVDSAYAAAVEQGAEIVHPLTDDPWGVRRFFVRDPSGHVINVLSHLEQSRRRRDGGVLTEPGLTTGPRRLVAAPGQCHHPSRPPVTATSWPRRTTAEGIPRPQDDVHLWQIRRLEGRLHVVSRACADRGLISTIHGGARKS